MRKTKIKNKARQHVRELLYSYKDMSREISSIRDSILYPNEKVSQSLENSAISVVNEKQIAFRAKFIAITDDVLRNNAETYYEIIAMKFFDERYFSWVAIAQKVGYSEEGCKKIERKIVDEIAERLGF